MDAPRPSGTILDRIVADVVSRLPMLRARAAGIEQEARDRPAPPSFSAALARPGLQVIAEVKRRSPSAGDIADDLDPVGQAGRYVAGGAAAVSVLTEPDHFGGSIADLAAVTATHDIPVLRKDFVIEPAQIWEARAAGAAAVLLIVAILDRQRLADLIAVTEEAGLDALVEVHDAAEAQIAAEAGARIVGVNNRDLATFVTDLATAERVAAELPPGTITVAESGIATAADAARMVAAGYDAVLVGEALVRAADPVALLRSLRGIP